MTLLGVKVDSTDLDKLDKSLDKVTKSSVKTDRGVNKLNNSLIRFSTAPLAVTAGLATVTAAVTALGVSSIAAASDLEETQGKFDVVFKGMTKTAEDWSDTLQEGYAMSERESKYFLSSILNNLANPLFIIPSLISARSINITHTHIQRSGEYSRIGSNHCSKSK